MIAVIARATVGLVMGGFVWASLTGVFVRKQATSVDTRSR